jgi:hypothetical protein
VKRHQLPLFPLILFLIGLGTMDADSKAPAIMGEGCFAWSTAKGCQSATDFGRMLDSGGKEFLLRTGFSQQAHPPVVVTLHSRTENPASFPYLKVDAIEGGMPRISVDLLEGKRQEDGDRKEVIQDEDGKQLLMAALLLREFYDGHAPIPGFSVPWFPAWVTRGLAALCFPAEEPFRIPSSYLKVKGGNPPTLEDFLIQRPPERSDPTISDLYDASAACLLKSGLSGSAGQAAFREWVGHLDQKQPNHVHSRWVGGWEMRPVERRWLLLMAGSSAEGDGRIQLQKAADSLKAYDSVMTGGIPEGASIHSLAQDKKSGGYTLAKLTDRLTALHLRANPLVLPLLDQTMILVAKAPKLPVKKIEAEEKRLAELRLAILQQSRAIDQYLDWYEAAKLPVWSGTFDKLLLNPDTVIKKGPVGRYLDAVETRGW